MIFSNLFGNETAAKVLLYMEALETGYPRAIAQALELPISQVQRQVERLEYEGVFSSRLVGRTRVYDWNPRCLYLTELRRLIHVGLNALPEDLKEKYFSERRRPRRRGKPL